VQQLKLLRSSLCIITVIICVAICPNSLDRDQARAAGSPDSTTQHSTTQHNTTQHNFRPVIALVFNCAQMHGAKEMKGVAVLSTAFLPIFKFSGKRLFCKASSYRRLRRHRPTSRNMQRIILQVGPKANCPLFLSRLTTVATFLLPKLPHFTEIRSQPSAVLTCGQTQRNEMAHFAAFPSNAKQCYRVPAAGTTPLWLSYR